MKRLLAILVTLAFVAAVGVGAWWYAGTRIDEAVARDRQAVAAALDEALDAQAAAVERIGRRFETVDNLLTAQELRLRRYRNADHLERARALGVGRVAGMAEIERLAEAGRLVRLEATPYYYIQPLEYSVPYVTPDAARLLALLGERFHDALRAQGLPLYRFNITSVLRTGENQAALRAINPNATGGVSTHEFGTTLDIVYHRYDYVSTPADTLAATAYPFLNERLEAIRRERYDALGMRYWQELQGILGRVLIALQDEGKVFVTLERQQPVFHLTVAEPLAGE